MLQIYNQQGLWHHSVEMELRASNEANVKLSYVGTSKMLLHNTKGCSNSKDVPRWGKVSEGCFLLLLPVYSTSRAIWDLKISGIISQNASLLFMCLYKTAPT